MTPEAGLDVCQFLHDAAAILLWGSYIYLTVLTPKDVASALERRLGTFRRTAVAVVVVTIVAALPLESAFIGSGWPDALDASTVVAVLLGTSVGNAWIVQAALALVLLAASVAPSDWRRVPLTVAAGAVLASLALTGHAVMQTGPLGLAHRANDALHVLAAGAWLGALLPLAMVEQTLAGPSKSETADVALRRFSTAGHGIVAVILATGVANTFLVLGHWPTDWASPYQAMLAAKITLVLAMICLAVLNRYVWLRRSATAPIAGRAVSRTIAAEIALGVTTIGLTSVFGMLEPT